MGSEEAEAPEIRCRVYFVTEGLDKVEERVAELVGELSRERDERQALEGKLAEPESQLVRATNFLENSGRFGAGHVEPNAEAGTGYIDRNSGANYAAALENSWKEQAGPQNDVSAERV